MRNTTTVSIRLTNNQRKLIKAAAALEDKPYTRFIVEATEKYSKKLLNNA